MSEDLKTTRYNDGTPIALVTKYDDWAGLNTPAYCWYNNDSTHKETYGAFYNWSLSIRINYARRIGTFPPMKNGMYS
jgi:hypothetical protein